MFPCVLGVPGQRRHHRLLKSPRVDLCIDAVLWAQPFLLLLCQSGASSMGTTLKPLQLCPPGCILTELGGMRSQTGDTTSQARNTEIFLTAFLHIGALQWPSVAGGGRLCVKHFQHELAVIGKGAVLMHTAPCWQELRREKTDVQETSLHFIQQVT